jgi:hypothetical protein
MSPVQLNSCCQCCGSERLCSDSDPHILFIFGSDPKTNILTRHFSKQCI